MSSTNPEAGPPPSADDATTLDDTGLDLKAKVTAAKVRESAVFQEEFSTRPMYYDKNGLPMGPNDSGTALRWAQLFEDDSYRILAEEMVGPFLVYTYWTGIDMSQSNHVAPQIFMTQVFDEESNAFEQRYATEEAAKNGHRLAVEMVKGWLPPGAGPERNGGSDEA